MLGERVAYSFATRQCTIIQAGRLRKHCKASMSEPKQIGCEVKERLVVVNAYAQVLAGGLKSKRVDKRNTALDQRRIQITVVRISDKHNRIDTALKHVADLAELSLGVIL